MSARLIITIPGNPWDGAINRRDGARVVRVGGKPSARIYKTKGYVERQDLAIEHVRQAVLEQQVAFHDGPLVVWATWWLDRRSHQHELPSWCPAADVDGPGKCHLDALRATVKRDSRIIAGGGAMADDVQVLDFHQRKRVGEPRAVLVVARLTGSETAC